MATSALGQIVTISIPTQEVFIPEAKNVWNQFDEHGLIVGLPRIRGESNDSYRRRILSVFAHRASSSYHGLINAITRELGLSLFYPIEINPKRSLYDDSFLASDPYILFDGSWLYLYSDYTNSVLDHKIDRFEPGGNYEHIGRLVDFINTSSYFEASLVEDADPYIRSMSIVNQSNKQLVGLETGQVSTRFKLENSRVVPGSFLTNNFDTFGREVVHETLVSSSGKYWLDYNKGIVECYNYPTIDIAFRYEYYTFPFRPVASPVILHDVNNDSFKRKMFEQVLQVDGSYLDGLPTELGTDIINELLSVVPMYWGI